jgi:hypothetical protein
VRLKRPRRRDRLGDARKSWTDTSSWTGVSRGVARTSKLTASSRVSLSPEIGKAAAHAFVERPPSDRLRLADELALFDPKSRRERLRRSTNGRRPGGMLVRKPRTSGAEALLDRARSCHRRSRRFCTTSFGRHRWALL